MTLGRTPLRRFTEFAFALLPRIARDAEHGSGLLFARGAGSPLTGSVTLTIWKDATAARAFAHRPDGARAEAIRRDAAHGLLSEQLILGMELICLEGDWQYSADRDSLEALNYKAR